MNNEQAVRVGSALAAGYLLLSLLDLRKHPSSIVSLPFWQKVRLTPILLVLSVTRLFSKIAHVPREARLLLAGARPSTTAAVDAGAFPSVQVIEGYLDRIGNAGPRLTGNEAHRALVDWLEAELRQVPGLDISSADIDLLRWQPRDDSPLSDIASLTVGDAGVPVPVAGAVPYSKPCASSSGPMLYVPGSTPLTAAVKGKMVLRDFPMKPVPYALGMIPSYSTTPDLDKDLLGHYSRPGLADQPLHEDLLAAGRFEAAGVIFMFDVHKEQVQSYFDPHKGTHYAVPAVYVGHEEALHLKALVHSPTRHTEATATIAIDAAQIPGKTRNLTAVLPGQSTEKVIYITHTDGNTFIQENGAAAVLALAKYFATLPLSRRRRTLEFAFNTGHLHISKEGTKQHAGELNETFERDDNVALIVPIEHLGAREIESVPRAEGPPGGRTLAFSGRGEMMFWCTGPIPSVVKAVTLAIARRGLDRVIATRGVSTPALRSTPMFTSFGGIGTYYHNVLLPTTSLISGPWSLWAPSFGKAAVDVGRLRRQALALGDVYLAVDGVDRKHLVAGYQRYRRRRAEGGRVVHPIHPREQAQDCVDAADAEDGAVVY